MLIGVGFFLIFRSKYIVLPRKVSMVGIHFVFTFKALFVTHNVEEAVGSLHHYRMWGEREENKVHLWEFNSTILNIRSQLIQNILTAPSL